MKGILVSGMAPAIVKAENIMRINPQRIIDTPPTKLIIPPGAGIDLREVAELFIHSADGRILGRVPLGYDGAPYREGDDLTIRQMLKPLGDMVIQETGLATHMVMEMPDPLDRSKTRRFEQPIERFSRVHLSSRQVAVGNEIEFSRLFVAIVE
jgi:hypothetical protein